jgi:hypothetical protein
LKTRKTFDRAERSGEKPLVLFAIEPRSYAQAIGGVAAEIRPNLEVLILEPEDLVREAARREPAVVLCGEPRPEGLDVGIRWAEFRPYEDPDVVLVDGLVESFPGFGLDNLVGLVDRLVEEWERRSG